MERRSTGGFCPGAGVSTDRHTERWIELKNAAAEITPESGSGQERGDSSAPSETPGGSRIRTLLPPVTRDTRGAEEHPGTRDTRGAEDKGLFFLDTRGQQIGLYYPRYQGQQGEAERGLFCPRSDTRGQQREDSSAPGETPGAGAEITPDSVRRQEDSSSYLCPS